MATAFHVEFVCTANICRSPYAEYRARAFADPASVVLSSSGVRARPGLPMDPEMAAQLRLRGVDPAGAVSRRTNREVVQQADVLLTMDSSHRAHVLDEWPAAMHKTFTIGQLAQVSTELPFGVGPREAIAAVFERRPPVSRELDVEDPYGQGPEAAQVAAQRIDQLLASVFAGLGLLPRSPWR